MDLAGAACTQLNLTSTVSIRIRTNIALHQLFAACRLAKLVREVEDQHRSQPLGEFWEEIFQYALGVVMLSVAALECYANELSADLDGVEARPVLPFPTPQSNRARATEVGAAVNAADCAATDAPAPREPILWKFEIAFQRIANRPMPKGGVVFANTRALIDLRNAVVHFRPEWFDDQDRHAKLSRRLAYKFQRSPFLPAEPLFPRAWASASFCDWSLTSTVRFIDGFFSQASLASPLEPFRSRLANCSGIRL